MFQFFLAVVPGVFVFANPDDNFPNCFVTSTDDGLATASAEDSPDAMDYGRKFKAYFMVLFAMGSLLFIKGIIGAQLSGCESTPSCNKAVSVLSRLCDASVLIIFITITFWGYAIRFKKEGRLCSQSVLPYSGGFMAIWLNFNILVNTINFFRQAYTAYCSMTAAKADS